MSASHRRPWQGATTKAWPSHVEEEATQPGASKAGDIGNELPVRDTIKKGRPEGRPSVESSAMLQSDQKRDAL